MKPASLHDSTPLLKVEYVYEFAVGSPFSIIAELPYGVVKVLLVGGLGVDTGNLETHFFISDLLI